MQLREKRKEDEEACLGLVRAVHHAGGYPRYLPRDLVEFLTPPYETASWVAEDEGVVVGHVALHDAAVDPTLEVAQRATGLPPERLAVIARLLVSPSVRRKGLGARLLGRATAHARSRGQRLVLDVTQDSAAPIALYEEAGWLRVGALRLDVDDKSLNLWVYVSPEPDAG